MSDLLRPARGEVARATGHRYQALEDACKDMPVEAQRDLIRLIRNLKQEAQSEKQKRRRGQTWG